MFHKLRRLCQTLRYHSAQQGDNLNLATAGATFSMVLMLCLVKSWNWPAKPYTFDTEKRFQQTDLITRNSGGKPTWNAANDTQQHKRAFRYLIEEPNFCSSHPDLQIISYVHSAVAKAENRQLIRDTWGSLRYYPQVRMRVMFVFGAAATEDEQRILNNESNTFHDIIQLDFKDSYKNLSYKGVSALQWITEHCQQAQWILKSDDDMIINIFGLASYLDYYSRWMVQTGKELPSQLMCAVWWGMPVLRGTGCAKWCVSREEWPDDTFPTYCSGSAFLMPIHVAPLLYNAYFHARFLWVDDAYISGVLAKEAGVKHKPLHSLYELNYHLFQKTMVNGNRLFCHYPGNAKPRSRWWALLAAKERRG